jgi:hypothetical protein
MSKRKKLKQSFDARLRSELRRSQASLLITEGASVLNTLIRWGMPSAAIVLASYFLAGKETGVKIDTVFRAFANQWVYLAIAGLAGGGWAVERRALKRRIKELADEKKVLEELVDPKRSTSGLSQHGTPS